MLEVATGEYGIAVDKLIMAVENLPEKKNTLTDLKPHLDGSYSFLFSLKKMISFENYFIC